MATPREDSLAPFHSKIPVSQHNLNETKDMYFHASIYLCIHPINIDSFLFI